MQIIKKEPTNQDGYTSYLVDFDGVQLWIDTHTDEEDGLTIEWNKYIFFTTDAQDMLDRKTQEQFTQWDELTELIQDYN
tara:strand:+ start:828 stop:1064 length:237 start_codon:yes stop_codon:yes gene_type:complete